MNGSSSDLWLHRFAWLTATVTLLLVAGTGAVVTSLKAGMIFSDWPSSDGHNMFFYPIWKAARDQFVEHGHRLSGTVTGMLSILLALFTWAAERRRHIRVLGLAIFAVVVVQGLLGGARVLLDAQTMALVHADFGAGVLCLMSVFVLLTGRAWASRSAIGDPATGHGVLALAIAILVSIMVQYFLGGVLRHLQLGWAWIGHPWFALVPVTLSPFFAMAARRSKSPLLVRGATVLMALIILQALLGLATWYVRFGVPSWGVVAEYQSPQQVIVCSLHKLIGMLTLMTSVVNVVCAIGVQPKAEGRVPLSVQADRTLAGVAT